MRDELKAMQDQKISITATFARYGLKSQYVGGDTVTMLLVDVSVDGGNIEIDHVWVNVGKTLAALNLREGSQITFNAWVKSYLKGFIGFQKECGIRQFIDAREEEIGINRLSRVKVVVEGTGQDFNAFLQKKRDQRLFISNMYQQIS